MAIGVLISKALQHSAASFIVNPYSPLTLDLIARMVSIAQYAMIVRPVDPTHREREQMSALSITIVIQISRNVSFLMHTKEVREAPRKRRLS